ncbi:hypothetical protein JOB18_019515%2C partial [Xyrichtys novacula]|uniref:CCHC-type domain-containing protein n=1 Tax=Xyrichtys novacula TaxID=13765 RepID=A0AAV1H047_XYRNO|nr:hypothetical protein JOB18_019515%2C partial [Xyrichtys novacula]
MDKMVKDTENGREIPTVSTTDSLRDGKRNMEKEKKNDDLQLNYRKELTVMLELEGQEKVTVTELLRAVRLACGAVVACRYVGERKYEVTMNHGKGKERLMEGLKIGAVNVWARELSNDELVVSFLNLPAYIPDADIQNKLQMWGVSAVSPIKRRMWPGTNIADGTRYCKVKFTKDIQSLPYSAKFNTATGAEFFRVIHDRQVKVCRLCIQPGHIFRECPEFICHKCGEQGHYARECANAPVKCTICFNDMGRCICRNSESEGGEQQQCSPTNDDHMSGVESEGNGADETCVIVAESSVDMEEELQARGSQSEGFEPSPSSRAAQKNVRGRETDGALRARATPETPEAPSALAEGIEFLPPRKKAAKTGSRAQPVGPGRENLGPCEKLKPTSSLTESESDLDGKVVEIRKKKKDRKKHGEGKLTDLD